MDPTIEQPEQPDGASETPTIDYRTASPDEVAAERNRITSQGGARVDERNYDGVDWRNVTSEQFHSELAKRGVHIRRWTH